MSNLREAINTQSPYLIAETAYSFEGEKNYLIDQVEKMGKDGAHALKYHMLFDLSEYMDVTHSLFKKLQYWLLSKKDWRMILAAAKEKGLENIVLTDDTKAIEFLDEYPDLVDGIELHAAVINDVRLLYRAIDFARKHDKVFVLGISGINFSELSMINRHVTSTGVTLLYMYGFQNYPTDFKKVNLKMIPILNEAFSVKIGYADHTVRGDENKENILSMAYGLGSNIQELHYVCDNKEARVDAVAAEREHFFKQYRKKMNSMCNALGSAKFDLNDNEKKYEKTRKTAVFNQEVKQGSTIKVEQLDFLRKENDFSKAFLIDLLGKKTNASIAKGTKLDSLLLGN